MIFLPKIIQKFLNLSVFCYLNNIDHIYIYIINIKFLVIYVVLDFIMNWVEIIILLIKSKNHFTFIFLHLTFLFTSQLLSQLFLLIQRYSLSASFHSVFSSQIFLWDLFHRPFSLRLIPLVHLVISLKIILLLINVYFSKFKDKFT